MTAAMFLAFILFLILSFPVAIAMGLSSCVPALIDSSFSADFVYIIRTMVVGIDSTPILAIPLFIISGTMMAQGGISGKLFDVFSYFLGNKTGGLLCATIADLSFLRCNLRFWSGNLCRCRSYGHSSVSLSWL